MPFELSLAKITVPGRNHRTNVAAANAVAKAFSNEPLQRGWLSCPSGDLEQSPSRIRTGRQARPAHRGPEVLDSHPIRNPGGVSLLAGTFVSTICTAYGPGENGCIGYGY